MHRLDAFVNTPRIAYFTMEVALHSDIYTYGGLGVLAGDTARSAADLEIPLNEGHSALLALELMRQYQRQPELIRPGECS